MQSDSLAHAFSALHHAVLQSNIIPTIGPWRLNSDQPRPDVTALLQAFAAFSAHQAQFGETERALLAALDLEALADPAWWAGLIKATTRANLPDEFSAGIVELCARLQVVSSGFPPSPTCWPACQPPPPCSTPARSW